MVDKRRNTPTLDQWKEGFRQLKRLGCSFAAFYGAEPLEEFEKLPEIIQFSEDIDISTTVITSGISDYADDKLKVLYEHGLRSITASYDDISTDLSSRKKSSLALTMIDHFRSFGPVRDVAVVVTLTRKNFRNLPDIIKDMSAKGIWTFFDLIHEDRGQPGSKVFTTDASKDLYFQHEDWADLAEVLTQVQRMKKDYLCHASIQFIETLKIVAASMIAGSRSPYLWNCSDYGCFPSWVTIDCDGIVYPCDDFQPRDENVPKVEAWNLRKNWPAFMKLWQKIVAARCPGCLWNTHIDAHLIKRGLLPLTDYIHGTEGKR
jgi:MoaA/NifB/PqqE/SkfB family radical SAM enzyme